jgi:hypothetical protein
MASLQPSDRERVGDYAPRAPERTVLYRELSQRWPASVEQAQEAGGLPKFVTEEVQGSCAAGCPSTAAGCFCASAAARA